MTGFLVRSPVPIVMLWGVDGVMIYNDAYSVFAGGRHPQLLGSKVREGWPEVADFNDNVMKVGLAGGTLAYRDQELTLYRAGKPEQVWMNLDYSPVLDESGAPAGVIAVVVETTERVLADRRAAAEQDRLAPAAAADARLRRRAAGPQHVFEYVNDAYVRISGRDELHRPQRARGFPGPGGPGLLRTAGSGLCHRRGGRRARHGAAPCRAASEVQYIDFVYQPIRDDQGAVTGIFVGGYEVTDAHRGLPRRLRELNADLERQVIQRTQARGMTWQLSPDLMGALNAEGLFRDLQPGLADRAGLVRGGGRRQSILELLHPDDLERTRAGFALTQHRPAGDPLSQPLSHQGRRAIAGSPGSACRRTGWSIAAAATSPRRRRPAGGAGARPRRRCASRRRWRRSAS